MPDLSPYCCCPGCGECSAHRNEPKRKARIKELERDLAAARTDLSEALALLREARDVMVEHMPHKIPTAKCPVCNVADRIDAFLAKERA